MTNMELPSITKPKNQKLATILALAGVVAVPGLHKFYLGRPVWGVLYLLFFWTSIPQIASVIEGVWYISQDQDEFDQKFNRNLLSSAPTQPSVDPDRFTAIAQALRQLEGLRQEGLISEYEFEQKRRQLLE